MERSFFADKRKNVHKKYQEKAQYPLDKSAENAIIQKLSDSTAEYGGIAQLGERLNGIQEVSGSIPLISTKSREIYSISRLFLYFLHKKLLWSCSRRIQDCLLDLLYFT